jgi:hypothetical protein
MYPVTSHVPRRLATRVGLHSFRGQETPGTRVTNGSACPLRIRRVGGAAASSQDVQFGRDGTLHLLCTLEEINLQIVRTALESGAAKFDCLYLGVRCVLHTPASKLVLRLIDRGVWRSIPTRQAQCLLLCSRLQLVPGIVRSRVSDLRVHTLVKAALRIFGGP